MPVHDWTRVYAGLFHDYHQTWSIRIKNVLNAGLLSDGLAALVERSNWPQEKGPTKSYADRANRIVVKHRLGRTIAVIEIASPGNIAYNAE